MNTEARTRLDVAGPLQIVGRTGDHIVTRDLGQDTPHLAVIDAATGSATLARAAGHLASVTTSYIATAGDTRIAFHDLDGTLRAASDFDDNRTVLWVIAMPEATWAMSTTGWDMADVGLNADEAAALHDLELSCFEPVSGELTMHFKLDRPDVTYLDLKSGPAGCRFQRVSGAASRGVVLIQGQDRSDGGANQRVLYFSNNAHSYRLLGQTQPRARGRSGLYQVMFANDQLLTAGYRDLARRDLEWRREDGRLRPFTDWPVAHGIKRLRLPGSWLETRHDACLAATELRDGTELLRYDPTSRKTESIGRFPGSVRPVGPTVPGAGRKSFLRPLSVDDDTSTWLSLDGPDKTTITGVSGDGKPLDTVTFGPQSTGVGCHNGSILVIEPQSDGTTTLARVRA